MSMSIKIINHFYWTTLFTLFAKVNFKFIFLEFLIQFYRFDGSLEIIKIDSMQNFYTKEANSIKKYFKVKFKVFYLF